MNIAKMHYFSIFFSQINKACVNLLRVWTKKTIYWKFWEIFRRFWKGFLRTLRKCIILADFSQHLRQPALVLGGFDDKRKLVRNFEKILNFFDENSIEKLDFLFLFLYFFENLLLKIEPPEKTPFFYNNLFGFAGFPPFLLATPLIGLANPWD